MKKMRSLFAVLIVLAAFSCKQNETPTPIVVVPGKIAVTANSVATATGSTVTLTFTTDKVNSDKTTSVDYTVTAGGKTLDSGTAAIPADATSTTTSFAVTRNFYTADLKTISVILSNALNGVIASETPSDYVIPTSVDSSLVFYLPLDNEVADHSIYHDTNIFTNITFGPDRLNTDSHGGVFNDSTTYLQYPNTTTLDTLTKLTLAAWVLPVSFYGTGSNPIIHKASSDVNAEGNPLPYYQYHLGMTGDQYWHEQGKVIFSLGLDGEYIWLNSADYNTWIPGEWIHIVATFDGSEMKLYINGVLNVSQTTTGSLGHYGRPVFIGKQELENDTPHQLPGTFDEVRIYSRALSADEVTSLYNFTGSVW